MLRTSICVYVVLALVTNARLHAQDFRYAVIELPDLGSSFQLNAVGGINSSGDVVGGAGFAVNFFHATLWPHDGGVIDLGTIDGNFAGAASINDLGDIAGWSSFAPNGNLLDRHATLWTGGQIIDLGTLGGETSVANAVNNAGQVVGQSEYDMQSSRNKACLWQNGEICILPAPHPDWDGREALAINDSGEIVGYGFGTELVLRALHWREGKVVDLGALTSLESKAYGINDVGTIVGYSRITSDYVHAVRWTNGQIEDIHTPNIGPNSIATYINERGQIVGDAYVSTRAFILNSGEQMLLLDDLVPPQLRLGWTMQRALGINEAGQIPVTASIGNDLWPLLLTPVNPTMTLQGPQPGRAGTTNGLRVTNVTPGASVTFLYSRFGGGTIIPGCDLQQNALQLDNPTVIGTAIANQQGVATITRPVPLIARGQTILFQAVVPGECAISQLVVHRFE